MHCRHPGMCFRNQVYPVNTEVLSKRHHGDPLEPLDIHCSHTLAPLASQEHNEAGTHKHKDSHTYKIQSQYFKVDSMYCWLSTGRPTKKTWQLRVQNHHDSECLKTPFWWKQQLIRTLTANVLASLCLYCCFSVCGCKRN